MACFILVLLFLAVARGQECSSGLLIVGGENQDGPLDSIHLLTSAGWCQNVKLPPLLEPISNPAVFVKNEKVVVCGFSTIHCQYAEAGSTEWLPFIWGYDYISGYDYVGPNETNYKMVDVNNMVMLTSTAKEDHRDGRYYLNEMRMTGNPPNERITMWLRQWGAAFRFGDRVVAGSCLVTVDTNSTGAYDNKEALLTGGWGKYVDCGHKCSSTQSDPGVGRWSINGNAAGTGPPAWESGVVDDMLFAREDHGCVGYMGGVLVSGGALYETYFHPMGSNDRITVLQSTEFWNGNQWQEVGSLLEARMDFKMKKFCGNVVAVGGRQYDLQQSIFLDTIEILEGNGADVHWTLSDIKLPNAMAKFGMAEVPDAGHFCGSEPFHCKEDGLFPNGPCENGFWSCKNGIEHFLECAKPLVFNPEINNCDFQSNTSGCNVE